MTTKKQTQIAELTKFSNELKDNGFNVIISAKHPFEWIFFEKDGKFGEVSPDHFFNYNFATVHKPCRECGTGYGIDRESKLTIDNALKTLVFAPYWATQKDMKAIVKYNNIEDFINSTHNKWAGYYIL